MENSHFDVFVVGGGQAGPSLASALAGAGKRVGLAEHVPCVGARLKNMSWGDGDKGAIRSHPLAPSIIAIKTRLFRLRLFDFNNADSAVAAHIGVADCLPLDARPGLKLIAQRLGASDILAHEFRQRFPGLEKLGRRVLIARLQFAPFSDPCSHRVFAFEIVIGRRDDRLRRIELTLLLPKKATGIHPSKDFRPRRN